MKISTDIAEIVGIILGDGHLHSKNNLITIVGSLEDIHYYKNRVIPLFTKVFGKSPTLKRRNDRNAYYLMLYSKNVMDYLTKVIGLKRGSKVNASIPKIIYQNKKLISAFLCGLFDTDGCLKFSKQFKQINYYPRIQIALRDSPIAKELSLLFKLIKFPYGTWEESRFNGIIFYQISGNQNINRWFKEISPKNLVHISKYQFWKQFGYYVPKSSLKFRIQKLSLPKPKIL